MRRRIDATIALHERVQARRSAARSIDAAAAIVAALGEGGKLLVVRQRRQRGRRAARGGRTGRTRFSGSAQALAAIALTTDTSVLTSVGQRLRLRSRVRTTDRGARAHRRRGARHQHERALAERHRRRSQAARAQRAADDCADRRRRRRDGAAGDIHINVPSTSTPRVQEVHRTLLHVICELVERAFA